VTDEPRLLVEKGCWERVLDWPERTPSFVYFTVAAECCSEKKLTRDRCGPGAEALRELK
jgi:hypothetical protein